MARVVSSTDISAAPEAVWEFMCDPNRFPEYVDATDRMVDVPDGDMRVGYTYKEYGGIRPFKGESEWRVTEFEPPRRQVHIGDDGMTTVVLTMDLIPTEDGTRLILTVDLRPRWFLIPINAILWPLLMRRRSKASMDKTIASMKRMVESSVAG